jgi:hypothetical protein
MWDDIKKAITQRKYFPEKEKLLSPIQRLLGETNPDFRYVYNPEKNVSVDLDRPFGAGFIPGPSQEPIISGYGEPAQQQMVGPEVMGATSGYGEYQPIWDMVQGYPGQRVSDDIWNLVINNFTPREVANMMAVAGAETQFGKTASSLKGDGQLKVNNLWNLFVNENKAHEPELPELLGDLQRNFGPEGPYREFTPETIKMYVGNDDPTNFTNNYKSFMRQMGYPVDWSE